MPPVIRLESRGVAVVDMGGPSVDRRTEPGGEAVRVGYN